MHIPDGFVNLPVAAATWVASGSSIAYAVKETNRKLQEKHVPMLGVLAAFIFAAQMLNFPVAGGTSGHLIGGALAAIMLGPWAGLLVMTAVLAVQAVVFQDGGILALGANIFNMGVVAVFTAFFVYRAGSVLSGSSRRATLANGFVAAWASVMASSLLVAVELSLSGTVPLGVALPAMAGIHAFIGIGEGLITAMVLSFLMAARPDLLRVAKV